MKDWTGHPSIIDFKKSFEGAINVLCIEDHEDFCSLLCEDILVSPLMHVKGVHSFDDAKNSLSSSRRYHSWVLDLSLERHNDGLDLLRMKNNFSYCVVLTGCNSVGDATEALKAGAYCCYDKIDLFPKKLNFAINSICGLSALSFSLKATRPSDINVFLLLLENFIRTPEEWAEKYFRTFRSIWNFCKINSELTPKQFLCLFHAIYFILLLDCLKKDFPGYEAFNNILEKRSDFYLQCVEFVLDNNDKIYTPLFL
jgi:hypothetical protein